VGVAFGLEWRDARSLLEAQHSKHHQIWSVEILSVVEEMVILMMEQNGHLLVVGEGMSKG